MASNLLFVLENKRTKCLDIKLTRGPFQKGCVVLDSYCSPGQLLDRSLVSVSDLWSNLTHFEMIKEDGKSVIGENFTIVNVTSEDSGLYFCVGQTNAGMTPGMY